MAKKSLTKRKSSRSASEPASTPTRTGRASKKKQGFPKVLILAPIIFGIILIVGGGLTIAFLKAAEPKSIPVKQLSITTKNNDEGELTVSSTEFEIVFSGQSHEGNPKNVNAPVDGYSVDTPVEIDLIKVYPDGNQYGYDQETRLFTLKRKALKFDYSDSEKTIKAQGKSWPTNGVEGGRETPLKLIVSISGSVVEWVPPAPAKRPAIAKQPVNPNDEDAEPVILTPEERLARRLEYRRNHPIDINESGPADLELIPHIGMVKANAIYDYREANGPFQSIDDLVNVKGIGKPLLAKIREYVTLGEVETTLTE